MVTRYNHYVAYDDIPHMEEHKNGEYVKYSDYLKLWQEHHHAGQQIEDLSSALKRAHSFKKMTLREELNIIKKTAVDILSRTMRPEGGVQC